MVDLLELEGDELVLDYGAGTGRVALATAARLPRGRVIAIDESPEMSEWLGSVTNAETLAIRENAVPLDDGASIGSSRSISCTRSGARRRSWRCAGC